MASSPAAMPPATIIPAPQTCNSRPTLPQLQDPPMPFEVTSCASALKAHLRASPPPAWHWHLNAAREVSSMNNPSICSAASKQRKVHRIASHALPPAAPAARTSQRLGLPATLPVGVRLELACSAHTAVFCGLHLLQHSRCQRPRVPATVCVFSAGIWMCGWWRD